MIRTYQFKRVQGDNQVNWDTLTQQHRFQIIYPTLTGFSSGSCVGAFLFSGALCWLTLYFQNTPTWGTDSYVDVPIPPLQIPNVYYPQHLSQLVNVTTAEVVNDECPEITLGPDNIGRIVLKNSGTAPEMKLTGFYLRN